MNSFEIHAMTVTNGIIFVTTYPPKIYKSSDNGKSWELSLSIKHTAILEEIESKGPDIYAEGFLSGIYSSTDLGLNWSIVNTSIPFTYSIKIFDNKILAASDKGLFYSTDKGIVWNLISNGLDSTTTTVRLPVTNKIFTWD